MYVVCTAAVVHHQAAKSVMDQEQEQTDDDVPTEDSELSNSSGREHEDTDR